MELFPQPMCSSHSYLLIYFTLQSVQKKEYMTNFDMSCIIVDSYVAVGRVEIVIVTHDADTFGSACEAYDIECLEI